MTTNAVPIEALAWLACAACALALATLVRALACDARTRTVWRAHVARLERDLRYLQLGVRGTQLATVQAACASGAAAAALVGPSPWTALGVALVLAAPALCLRQLRERRSTRVAAQLDTGLLAIANALEAGGSLAAALEAATSVLQPPLRDELALSLREHALGAPLEQTLGDLSARVGRPTVSAALVTLQLAHDTGGDVIDALRTSAASLRELARLEGVVQSKTAEARAQAVVIGVVPAPLLTLLDRLDPEFLAPVWTTTTGHLVLAVAGALWAAAMLIAREIMDVDV